ncbi:hypothetical protein [Burkholderia stagnalis]|uniref:hypothetical protein n=1 Tax=Burkholderia stagnalis TaxID=1503054 RepID=UPI001E2B2EB0|nr:hypothetical protein [Burkholderia stagnalis]
MQFDFGPLQAQAEFRGAQYKTVARIGRPAVVVIVQRYPAHEPPVVENGRWIAKPTVDIGEQHQSLWRSNHHGFLQVHTL